MSKDTNPAYVSRPVLNGRELCAWAQANGLTGGLDPRTMHVTVLYSKTPMKFGDIDLDSRELVVQLSDARTITISSALGMPVADQFLHERHKQLLALGASHDYADGQYRPHVTLKYGPSEQEISRLSSCVGFTGEIRLGPEQIEPLRIGWRP